MTCFFGEPYLNILFFIGLPLETKDKVEKDKQKDLGKTAPSNHDRVRGNHGTVYAIGGHKNRRHIRNSFLRQSACSFIFFFLSWLYVDQTVPASWVCRNFLIFLTEMVNWNYPSPILFLSLEWCGWLPHRKWQHEVRLLLLPAQDSFSFFQLGAAQGGPGCCFSQSRGQPLGNSFSLHLSVCFNSFFKLRFFNLQFNRALKSNAG